MPRSFQFPQIASTLLKTLSTFVGCLTLGFTFTTNAKAQMPPSPIQEMLGSSQSDLCAFPELNISEDFFVFAAGDYNGSPLPYPIDQSGNEAGKIDIVVNSPDKPVVLMLGAYDPTIWNIQWTQSTQIAGVLVSGYHRQAVAGLPEATPLLTSTFAQSGECGFFSVTPEHYKDLNPLSRHLFGQDVEMMFLPEESPFITVGKPIDSKTQLLSSPDTSIESFFDTTSPLSGAEGLAAAVEQGILRLATDEDIEAWVEAIVDGRPTPDIPPIAGVGIPRPSPPPIIGTAYVVLDSFTLPVGLSGAHSAVFFVPEGVPSPENISGHSSIYDFNTLECSGSCPLEHLGEYYSF